MKVRIDNATLLRSTSMNEETETDDPQCLIGACMKVRIETADLLIVENMRSDKYGRHYERKSVRVGIHPDNSHDYEMSQIDECSSALDNTIYYWFSESEFAEVQKHLDDETLCEEVKFTGVYLLEETTEEDTLILGVSDNNEPFEIKEKDNA